MLTIILKILYHRFLVGLWVWWSTLGNTVKKWLFKKILPQLRKTSCIIILIILHKWEKRVTERNKRLSLWILFINWGTQPIYDFCWLNHWTWPISDPMPGSWFSNFFKNGEGWDCFWLAKVLSRLRKIIYLPKISKNKQVGWILVCSKAEKWLSILNCSTSAKWAIWESIYQQSWRS